MSLQPGSSMVHHGLNPHNNLGEEVISEDEARKRREQLNRRPSYRMILKDLETADKNLKKEPEEATSGGSPGSAAVTAPITSDPLHVQIPAPVPMPRQPGLSAAASSPYASPSAAVSAGLLPPAALNALHAHGALNGGADLMAHGLDYSNQAAVAAVVAASRGAGGHGRLTPSSSQDLSQQSTPTGSSGQLMVNPDLLGLKPMSDLSAPNSFGGGQDWQSPLLSGGYTSSPSPPMPGGSRGGEDESSRKRQVRLLKNREAAKECRRKKKEYVKCLENRVAVLENQNKALIEELKTLKELYCRKEKNEM